jgi:hypothetical protein
MSFRDPVPFTVISIYCCSALTFVRSWGKGWSPTIILFGFQRSHQARKWLIQLLKLDRISMILLCPFAVYYLRYAVRSFFTMSRISLADGKRAGQKVHRKIAAAVQKVKSPVLFIPLFWNPRKIFPRIILFASVIKLPVQDGGFREGGIRDGEIGKGQIEEGGWE